MLKEIIHLAEKQELFRIIASQHYLSISDEHQQNEHYEMQNEHETSLMGCCLSIWDKNSIKIDYTISFLQVIIFLDVPYIPYEEEDVSVL